MRRTAFFPVALAAIIAASAAATHAAAQERGFLARDSARTDAPAPMARMGQAAGHNPNLAYNCRGPIARVEDVAFEGVKTTSFNFGTTGGGGESGRFDRTPVLSTRVVLAPGTCLNAHFSALVGSRQMYGVSAITMFQVTLTPLAGGAPRHMVGHYEHPYGMFGPAVAIEAERDVDEIAAVFFQRAGSLPGDVAPGAYRVDVWWSGGPATPGGAIAADFVLKLYFR